MGFGDAILSGFYSIRTINRASAFRRQLIIVSNIVSSFRLTLLLFLLLLQVNARFALLILLPLLHLLFMTGSQAFQSVIHFKVGHNDWRY